MREKLVVKDNIKFLLITNKKDRLLFAIQEYKIPTFTKDIKEEIKVEYLTIEEAEDLINFNTTWEIADSIIKDVNEVLANEDIASIQIKKID